MFGSSSPSIISPICSSKPRRRVSLSSSQTEKPFSFMIEKSAPIQAVSPTQAFYHKQFNPNCTNEYQTSLITTVLPTSNTPATNTNPPIFKVSSEKRFRSSTLSSPNSELNTSKQETLKSALKSLHSNAISQPLAPTKFVHFDSQLKHIKFFTKADTPLSLTQRSVEYEEDYAFDFESDDDSSEDDTSQGSSASLLLLNCNFPSVTPFFDCPVRCDNICLSETKDRITGKIKVQNLAFHKNVTVRYTSNFWQTYDDVSASYEKVLTKSASTSFGFDLFSFSINLDPLLKSLEMTSKNNIKKILIIAIRYQVANLEYWDNNQGQNYQVELSLEKTLNTSEIEAQLESPQNLTSPNSYSLNQEASSPECPFFSTKSLKSLGQRYSFSSSFSSDDPIGTDKFTPQMPSFLPANTLNQQWYNESYNFSYQNSAQNPTYANSIPIPGKALAPLKPNIHNYTEFSDLSPCYFYSSPISGTSPTPCISG